MKDEKVGIEDAISILWVNAPEAMEVLIDELKLFREEKFNKVREAKSRGLCADWVLGEMLAYQEMIANLERPDVLTQKPLQ